MGDICPGCNLIFLIAPRGFVQPAAGHVSAPPRGPSGGKMVITEGLNAIGFSSTCLTVSPLLLFGKKGIITTITDTADDRPELVRALALQPEAVCVCPHYYFFLLLLKGFTFGKGSWKPVYCSDATFQPISFLFHPGDISVRSSHTNRAMIPYKIPPGIIFFIIIVLLNGASSPAPQTSTVLIDTSLG